MSCSQIADEFTSYKFRLNHPFPSTFALWRYTCFSGDRSYYNYRILYTSLLILLVLLDFFWIIGFGGAGSANRISASLDATQFALVFICIAYVLLACSTAKWLQVRLDANGQQTMPYKFAWFIYTVSVNAIYVCMVIFWVSDGWTSPLEQKLKNSIPGCLVLIDLCLSGVPLYFCHVIYVIVVYLVYLAIAALILFLCYTFGVYDKHVFEPSNPTAWVGGNPLLPNGFYDFTNVHRILTTAFGTVALAIAIHCILLSVVVSRDFLASLCHRSTEAWIRHEFSFDSEGALSRPQSSVTISSGGSTPSATAANRKAPF